MSIEHLPIPLQQPISDMRKLTYPRVLEGLLPKSVISYQHNYFRLEKSQKTGSSWGKQVYKLFWKVLKNIWIGRNNQLHKTERIRDLQGLPTLKEAIRSEYALGLHWLPACEFSIYFCNPIELFLTRDIESLKEWL